MAVGSVGQDSRSSERLPVSLQASIASTECITRDVSASGVYIESGAPFELGERVDFVIDFDSPGGKLKLKCNGEVVRVEKKNGKVGVAVKIVESLMQSGQDRV